MSRPHAALCFLAGLAVLAERAAAQPLGKLSQKIERVAGSVAGERPVEMRTRDPVRAGMHVETGRRSAAKFAIGRGQNPQGAVTMGPESRFRFKRARFDAAGLLTSLDFEIEWGRFRLAMMPPLRDATKLLGQPVGVVQILTPGGPIELRGTDVYLYVARDGTTIVYVAEGEVTVGEEGRLVGAGYWTSFGPGRAPAPPERIDGGDGGERRPQNPDLPSPLLLDLPGFLRLQRFDLPR